MWDTKGCERREKEGFWVKFGVFVGGSLDSTTEAERTRDVKRIILALYRYGIYIYIYISL